MIEVYEYDSAIDFLEEVTYHEAEFSHTDLMNIASSDNLFEVSLKLDELIKYTRFKKVQKYGDTYYTNLPSHGFSSMFSISELESISRAWSNGLIELNDPQEREHLNALKSHIERLKKDSELY